MVEEAGERFLFLGHRGAAFFTWPRKVAVIVGPQLPGQQVSVSLMSWTQQWAGWGLDSHIGLLRAELGLPFVGPQTVTKATGAPEYIRPLLAVKRWNLAAAIVLEVLYGASLALAMIAHGHALLVLSALLVMVVLFFGLELVPRWLLGFRTTSDFMGVKDIAFAVVFIGVFTLLFRFGIPTR